MLLFQKKNASIIKDLATNESQYVVAETPYYGEEPIPETGNLTIHNYSINFQPGSDDYMVLIDRANYSTDKVNPVMEDPHCVGFLLYDPTVFDDVHLMFTYFDIMEFVRAMMGPFLKWQSDKYCTFPNVTISLNRTIVDNNGIQHKLDDWVSRGDVKADFWVKEEKNNAESYNVWCNVEGKDNSKRVIIGGGHYDGVWGQCARDNAVSIGMMLGILKYFNDHKIIPKFNTTFITFAGHEYGFKGSRSYVVDHYDFKAEDIKMMIIAGSCAQNVTNSTLSIKSLYKLQPLKRLINKFLIEKIVDQTDYDEIFQDKGNKLIVSQAFTWLPIAPVENQVPSTDGVPFWHRFAPFISFGKRSYPSYDGYYHCTGVNHTKGDILSSLDQEDMNVTTDLIFNVTKFYAIDPDCWFESSTYNTWDSSNDDINDSVNVTFSIDTTLPNDQVMVRAILYPKATLDHPAFPFLYRYEAKEYYTITPDGIEDTLTISLPKYAPKGNYVLHLHLYNSTGEVIFTTLEDLELELVILNYLGELFGMERFLDLIDIFEQVPGYGFDVLEDILDVLGIYPFANESYTPEKFYLYPPNHPPEKPSTPDSPEEEIKAGKEYFFNTSTYDEDGDQIYYEWKWRNWIFSELDGWYGPYDSYETHQKGHIWDIPLDVGVRVRARDEWWSPNVYSEWSDPWSGSGESGCSAELNSQCSQSQPVQSQSSQEVLVVDQAGMFNGLNYGLGGGCTYEWYFGDSTNATGQNISHSYNQTGLYNVSLTVKNDTAEVNYSMVVSVVNLISGFNVTSSGAQPSVNIGFTDFSDGVFDITDWIWDFGDGNVSYDQNVSHNYSVCGVYNVTLTVSDDQGNNASSYFIVYIELTPPRIVDAYYHPYHIGVGSNMTISAVFFDNQSKIGLAKVNVSYPDGSNGNFNMNVSENSPSVYEYVFSDTDQVGDYYFSIWVADNANNSNSFSGCSFYVDHIFGYTVAGNQSQNIKDRITGSNFTVLANGTADSISAYIETNLSIPPKTKCMIYRDSTLLGATEEKILNTGSDPVWVTYNFTGSKPSLVKNTEYVLACWSNDTCNLFYDNSTNVSSGRYANYSYGDAPDPINWSDYESRIYSIYCSYSTVPNITDVSADPSVVGFGYNVTISATIDDNYCGIENVSVNISYPDNSAGNFTMNNNGNYTFEYVFSDTWLAGEYDFTIWAVDSFGGSNSSSGHSFDVSVEATVSVCTIKDEYGNNESVNLTDSPGDSDLIGYEFLDDGNVLRIWNRFDSYYFDTDDGIQLTNHYDDYWSHNVLMLGYYNNDQWNLIYRNDELSGFNKDIESDNETFVNATLWKDLGFGGYDFRLAIRYHLGVDDNELTVMPYIKNLGQSIPYILGFGWEMKDIQINMTEAGDYINVNRNMYYLNQTLDNVYTDLSESEFYLMENITDTSTKSLYLKWNQSLNYKLCVKSREGQYNAPVTLFIRVGTLDSGQEKYTKMYWYDAEQFTYFFNSFDDAPFGEAWASHPIFMVDVSTSTHASTTSNGDVELCDENDCPGDDLGTISMVELRVSSYYSGSQHDTILRPVFGGTVDGLDYHYQTPTQTGAPWSQWFDITKDPFAPQSWDWTDIEGLDCDVEAETDMGMFTLYCSKVEMRVTYKFYNYDPVVSNPGPADGATGVSIQPVLNITVSDPDGDNMNITWFSNSSGDWDAFASNSSINNGTYHQTFTNASENGKWWYWLVNVSDGVDYRGSSVYKLYTGYQSKIKNVGSTNIKGYLLIQVQYYNTSNSTWVVADDTINESTPRTIASSGQLGLDTIFNGNVNTSYLINNFGTGTYRIFTAFRDPDGDVLVVDDDSLLEASYQFTVTTS